jgi:hypothetical protein
MLLGVGGAVIAAEARWSAWRIPLQSILIWQALVVVALALDPDEMGGLLNWYSVAVVGGVVALAALHAVLDWRGGRALGPI